MSASMKLLYAPASPFARKVRAAAIELGLNDRIELEPVTVTPGKPNESVRQRNPLRKIPALVIGDGSTIFNSTVICEYLDELAGGGVLIPRDPSLRYRVLTNHALAHGICEAALLARYENFLRPEGHRWSVWSDEQWDKVNSALEWFEQHPGELEGSVNLAHVALGCALGYLDFRSPEHNWKERFPGLRAWHAQLKQRPSFALTEPQ